MTAPRTLLNAWNIHAKKKFGQNFLTEPATTKMIVSRSMVGAEDIVLEIGSGLGALTIPLANAAKKVYAIERDRQLVPLLKNEVLAAGFEDKTEIINDDILNVDLKAITETHNINKLILMGNLPYNISSQILIWLVKHRQYVNKAVFMFQKELAERIASPPGSGDYGRLSAVVQYCATINRIAVINSGQFFPKPKVDSEVIEIDFFEEPPDKADDEDFLFQVIKAAFGKRRKNLRNSLSKSDLNIDTETVHNVLEICEIDYKRRAETLTIKEFVHLSNALLSNKSG